MLNPNRRQSCLNRRKRAQNHMRIHMAHMSDTEEMMPLWGPRRRHPKPDSKCQTYALFDPFAQRSAQTIDIDQKLALRGLEVLHDALQLGNVTA